MDSLILSSLARARAHVESSSKLFLCMLLYVYVLFKSSRILETAYFDIREVQKCYKNGLGRSNKHDVVFVRQY
jgi:hypothetical protein